MNDSANDNYSNLEFYDNNSSSSTGTIKLETLSPISQSPKLSMMDALSNNRPALLSNNPILTTASVPIPSRNCSQRMMVDLSDMLDLESAQYTYTIQELGNYQTNTNSSSLSSFVHNNNVSSTPIEYDTNFNTDGNTFTGALVTNTLWNEGHQNVMSPSSNTSVSGYNAHGQFHMDEDLYLVDKDDLVQLSTHEPTLNELHGYLLIDEILTDSDFHAVSQQLNNFSQPSPNLSGDSGSSSAILSSPILPQQILHSSGSSTNLQNTQIANGIFLGNDVLYDDRTNASSSPYDIYTSSVTPTHSRTSQSAAFSPGSQSSNSSLIMNSPHTPPPAPHPVNRHKSGHMNNNNSSTKNQNSATTRSSSGLVHHNPKYSTLQQLLLKRDFSPDNRSSMGATGLGQSVPSPPSSTMVMSGTALSPSGYTGRRLNFSTQMATSSGGTMSRLSTSAPTHLGLDQIWQRREPRPHLLSTGSLIEAESTSSLSTAGILSPEAPDFSHDEGYSDDDDNDSDHYEDLSSDDSDDEQTAKEKKAKRYFWQYNVQAKGPKGQRLVIKTHAEDPHVLNEATDPVFSPHCSVRGIKDVRLQHSGKARKGDGNDLTPNPKKLHSIGKELDKLGRVINDMTPVSELPFNVRPKTRKEKNKLASRACRLKKKAQHEANKIKLYGLENEHKRLMNGITQLKQVLAVRCSQSVENADEFNNKVEKVIKSATKVKIAGTSTDYVNRILENVKNGIQSGNIDKALEN